LFFLAVLVLYGLVRGTAWDLYSTFILKERHGFNKETLSIFISDFWKKFLLTIVLGVPIYILFMKVIQWGG